MSGELSTIKPGQESIETAVSELKRCEGKNDIAALSNRHLKDSVYGVFLDKGYRGFDEDFLKIYSDVLVEKGKSTTFRAIYQVYIDEFDETSPVTNLLSKALIRMQDLASQEKKDIINNYRLLEPGQVGQQIGDIILEQEDPKTWLERIIGLQDGAAYKSIGFSVMKSVMNFISTSGNRISKKELDKIIHWVSRDNDYRFKFNQEIIINGIMNNVLKNRVDKQQKKQIQNFFLKVFGDPRFSRNDRKWDNVDKNAKKKFIRWLTDDSLDIFLEIIGQTAYPEHWEKRKEFWTQYRNASYIDEAYVVFGPVAKRKAESLYRDTRDEAYRACGKIRNPSQKDQSALLMRMGKDVIISEGSHNKKLHIWKSKKNAPKFYQEEYSRDSLKNDSDFTERHDPHGKWCEKAAEFIRKASGNRVRI